MHKISRIIGRQILDSRGNPTIEVDLYLDTGAWGRASVPSGASLGLMEAIEKRDGDLTCFRGKSVNRIVNSVNTYLADSLSNRIFDTQEALDHFLIALDGTKNKSNLGANTTLAISLAFAKAIQPKLFLGILGNNIIRKMPVPMLNFINGGEHAQNELDIQEFMILPTFQGTFMDKMEVAHQIFYKLRDLLSKNGYSTALGDEGGFAPTLRNTKEALDFLSESAIEFQGKVYFALDCAANSFFKEDHYLFENKKLSTQEMLSYYTKLVNDYPIISMEDPFSERDLDGWVEATKLLGKKILLVGDDIFVTNKELFDKYSKMNIANSILIKMNQVGTLTETIETAEAAKASGYKIIASHRSGETEDVSLSHLAIGLEADYIKAGSICRTERVCKYNELIRIESEHLIY
ncbi:Enolase [Candidatus Cyrtobacter comes]|uniref:Enolase n=1 Tax=Candidatus Cyrtobacter comes TaxID=675776 RepID=A0ABU5LA27_9RICK|nr:phosphopyruvate hydratase [Candidatus Cyrtobacter comes]MDZ5762699.1 Enolase [Candidatus Cyrtobacter comes]